MQRNATAKFMDISEQWTTRLSPSLQLIIAALFHKYTMQHQFNYTGIVCCVQNSTKIKHYFFYIWEYKGLWEFAKHGGSVLHSSEYTNQPYWPSKNFCHDAIEMLFGMQYPLCYCNILCAIAISSVSHGISKLTFIYSTKTASSAL
jgi:hypothetical protein